MAKKNGNMYRLGRKYGSVDSLKVPDDDSTSERRLSFSSWKKNG